MVTEITDKVLNSQRDLSIKPKKDQMEKDKIVVVSTHEADQNIVKAVKDSEENLKKTQSFRNQNGKIFKYVKKVGPNLKTHVNTLKHQALGTKRGKAKKCGAQGCQTCGMIITEPSIMIRNRKIRLSEGSCKTCKLPFSLWNL